MLQPGGVIGGYRLEALLGRGAMGEVWKATQLSLRRPVALKRIAEHLVDHPDALARFSREAQVVARVHSAHVVAVHDFGRFTDDQGRDHHLLVMELVESGISLRKCVGSALPWPVASSIALQVAEGLAAASELGIVHRDIKPDNLLVTASGVVKITDFGLARAVDSTAMTRQGALLGTPLYMAPETWKGEPADGRTDLYALGCTWYEALAGRPPYRADNSAALLRCHLDEPVPDIRVLVPDTPAAIAELVMALMAKDPEARPPTARALADGIRGLSSKGLEIPSIAPELGYGKASPDVVTAPTVRASNQVTVATMPVPLTPNPSPPMTMATIPPASPAARSWLVPTLIGVIVVLAGVAAFAVVTGLDRNAAPPRDPALQPVVGAATVPAPLVVLPPPEVAPQAVVTPNPPPEPTSVKPPPSEPSKTTPAARIDAAIAANDLSAALQAAEAWIAAEPGSPEAMTGLRRALRARLDGLLAQGRCDDAITYLAEIKAHRSWLVIDEWERDALIAQASADAKAGRSKQTLDRFAALRHRFPQDLQVNRAAVLAIGETDQAHEALGDALVLSGSPAALPAQAVAILRRALSFEGPMGDTAAAIRKALIARDPQAVANAKAALGSDDETVRGNALRLLDEAGALTPGERARVHLRDAMTLSSSYTIAREAVAWLAEATKRPDWKTTLVEAGIAMPETIPALSDLGEHGEALVTTLLAAYGEVAIDRYQAWARQTSDLKLRWRTFGALKKIGKVDAADEELFHTATLTCYETLGNDQALDVCLAYFKAWTLTPRAEQARLLLKPAIHRCKESIDQYDEAGLGLHARNAKRTLQVLEDAYDAIERP